MLLEIMLFEVHSFVFELASLEMTNETVVFLVVIFLIKSLKIP